MLEWCSIIPGAIISKRKLIDMFFPVRLTLLREFFQHVNHSSVPPLHGTITLRMIRGGSGRLNTTQLMESREHLVVKLLPLVVMQFLRESKPHNKFIEDLFTSCSTFVVTSWINLHKPRGPVEPIFRIINGPVQLRDKITSSPIASFPVPYFNKYWRVPNYARYKCFPAYVNIQDF